MRPAVKWGMGLLVALHAGVACADDQPAAQAAQGANARFSVWPVLHLTMPTEGAAMASVGIDFQRGLTDDWDVSIAPTVGARSSGGLATLFSARDGIVAGPTEWKLGLNLTFIGFRIARDQRSVAEVEAKQAAFDACTRRCGTLDASAAERQFCAGNPARAAAWQIDPAAFCNDDIKQALVAALDRADAAMYARRALYPPTLIALGVTVGRSRFGYLTPDAAMALGEKSDDKLSWSAAISYTRVSLRGVTLEVPLALRSAWSASPDTVKWCTPAGTVPRGQSGQSDAAETCQEGTLGAPTESRKLFATIQVGYVQAGLDKNNAPDTIWRATVGPYVSYAVTDAASRATVGLQAPLFLSFARATASKYQGVVRLTPSFSMTQTASGGWEPQVFMRLEIFGERSLFPRALEWL